MPDENAGIKIRLIIPTNIEIDEVVKQVQQKLNNHKLNIGLNLSPDAIKGLEKINQMYKNIAKETTNIKSPRFDLANPNKEAQLYLNRIQAMVSGFKRLNGEVKYTYDELGKVAIQMKNAEGISRNLNLQWDSSKNVLRKTNTKTTNDLDIINEKKLQEEQKINTKLQEDYRKQIQNSLSSVENYYNIQQSQIQKTISLRQKELEQLKQQVYDRLSSGNVSDEKQLQYEQKIRQAIEQEKQRQIQQSLTTTQNYYNAQQNLIQKTIALRKKEIEQLKEKAGNRLDSGLASNEKQLNYEITLRDKIQKQIEQEIASQKELEIYQRKMQNSLSKLQIGKESIFSRSNIRQETEGFLAELNKMGTVGGKSTKEVSSQFDTLKTHIAQLSGQLKNVNKDGYGMVQMFELAAKKVAIWSVATSGVYFFINQIQAATGYIFELDNALNEIRIVTGQSEEDVNALASSYNNLAKEMNVTTTEIAKQAVELYRQGLSGSEVDERMKSIIEYAKISGISLEESNKIITATANATGESVTKIIDIFALLGDKTASGADEIGEALQKVASTAESMGVSIEKASSWIATISSKTRESAQVTGNSIKSMMARYAQIKEKGFNQEDATNINMVTKALKAAGIVATDNDGQLRNFGDVIDELMTRWDGLEENTKRYIATSIGGTYQLNRFYTLMNNSKDATKNYELALNSAGTAEQKFAIYQESSQATLDRFTATLQGLYQNSLNSGFIKALIGLGTGLVSLIDKIGLANTSLMLLGGYLGSKFLIIIPGLTNALVNLGTAMVGLGVSANVAATAMSMLNAAIPLAVVLLAAKAFDTLYVSVQEQKQKVSELNTEFSNLKSTLDQYKAIKNPTESQKEYIGLLQQELDIKGDILAREREIEAQKSVFGDGTFTKGIQGDTQSAMVKLRDLQNTERTMQNLLNTGIANSSALESIKGIKQGYQEVQNTLLESKRSVDGYIKSLGNTASPELINRLQSYSDELSVSIAYVQTLTGWQNKNTQAQKANAQATEDTATKLQKLQAKNEATGKSIDSLNSILGELDKNHKLSGKTLDEVANSYPDLLKYIDNEKTLREQLVNKIGEETDSYQKGIQQKLLMTDGFINAVLTGNTALQKALVNAYGQDAKNFESYTQLKNQADALLVQTLGNRWSQFYKSEKEALVGLLNGADELMASKGTRNKNGTISVSPEAENAVRQQLNQAKVLVNIYDAAEKKSAQIAKNISVGTVKSISTGKSGSGSGSSKSSTPSVKSERDSVFGEIEKFILATKKANDEYWELKKLTEKKIDLGIIKGFDIFEERIKNQENYVNKLFDLQSDLNGQLTDWQEKQKQYKPNTQQWKEIQKIINQIKSAQASLPAIQQREIANLQKLKTVYEGIQKPLDTMKSKVESIVETIKSIADNLKNAFTDAFTNMNLNEQFSTQMYGSIDDIYNAISSASLDFIREFSKQRDAIFGDRNEKIGIWNSIQGVNDAETKKMLEEQLKAWPDISDEIRKAGFSLDEFIDGQLKINQNSIMLNEITAIYNKYDKLQKDAEKFIYDEQQKLDIISKENEKLERQLQINERQLKIDELQAEINKVKADKRFELIDLNGSRTLTYDTAKVADLEKQITDEQKEQQKIKNQDDATYIAKQISDGKLYLDLLTKINNQTATTSEINQFNALKSSGTLDLSYLQDSIQAGIDAKQKYLSDENDPNSLPSMKKKEMEIFNKTWEEQFKGELAVQNILAETQRQGSLSRFDQLLKETNDIRKIYDIQAKDAFTAGKSIATNLQKGKESVSNPQAKYQAPQYNVLPASSNTQATSITINLGGMKIEADSGTTIGDIISKFGGLAVATH